jgi:hypothetical protein
MVAMGDQSSTPQWEDIEQDGSLSNFAEQVGVNLEYLAFDKAVLLLPRNRMFTAAGNDQNLFPSGTKELVCAFQEGGLDTAIYKDERSRRDLVLKSEDIVLPILLFMGSIALSLGLNVLSNWIYDRFANRKNKVDPVIKLEYAEVDANRKISRWRRVECTASSVAALLEKEGATPLRDKRSPVEPDSETAIDEKEWITQCRIEASAAEAVARQLVEEANVSLKAGDKSTAENLFRRALAKLREAHLWEPGNSEHIILLHKFGRSVHDLFQCLLAFREGSYHVTCPVMLSHSKGGFSVGGAGKTICSICGLEIFDCGHIKGRRYDGVVATRYGELCSICGRSECGHVENEVYNNVTAFGLITEMRLDHVSFVENPANPLCVIQGYSLSVREILQSLATDERTKFVPGESPLYCHHCLSCTGSDKSLNSLGA